MLVLSREPGEAIIIGDDVIVQVISVKGDRVKLGVAAPRGVAVDRVEVRERKEGEKGGE